MKGVGAVGSCSDAMDFRPVGPLTYVGDCSTNGVEGVPGMILRRRRWIGDEGDAGGCALALSVGSGGSALGLSCAADTGEPASTGSLLRCTGSLLTCSESWDGSSCDGSANSDDTPS